MRPAEEKVSDDTAQATALPAAQLAPADLPGAVAPVSHCWLTDDDALQQRGLGDGRTAHPSHNDPVRDATPVPQADQRKGETIMTDSERQCLIKEIAGRSRASRLQPGEFTIRHYAEACRMPYSVATRELERFMDAGHLIRRKVKHRGTYCWAYRAPDRQGEDS